jgi:hypothetical protein
MQRLPNLNRNLNSLTQINLDDLVNAFGWKDSPALARMARILFFGPAQKFARQMLDFDSAIAEHGLADASRLTMKHFALDIRVYNSENIPSSGYLALSNHPGMTDTLSLFCALNRSDLKIIALQRPFLESLSNMSKQLFYVTENSNERVGLVRRVSAHLRSGGAALTFPAGHVEPDPDVYNGALESLQTWTDSVGVFMRMAPEAAILPVLVRNVIWGKIAHHPFLRIKRTQTERELLAVALQLLSHLVFGTTPVIVKVQIGKPITIRELGTSNSQVIHKATLAAMKGLIENPPVGEGTSAL